jgi:hypothetical protein
MPVSLRGIERELRGRLRAAGRADLAERALDGVRLTDDGGTVYVHVFMRPEWREYRDGDAYPLAFADHPDLRTLAQWRDFLNEAQLLLRDDFERIVAWLDGR